MVSSNGSPEAWASRWRTVDPDGPAASSRSSTPSSAATSTASAVTGFESEASRTARVVSPHIAMFPAALVTPAAANGTSQASIWCRASTPGDTTVLGSPPREWAFAVRARRGLLASRGRGRPRARRRNFADPLGRHASARRRLRPGRPLPTNHRRGARARRAHEHLRHRPGPLGRGGTGARRRVRRHTAGGDLRRRPFARRRLAGRDRGRGGAPVKQVIPPSITGREGAPAASVVDHRFGAGDPYTLGVEEEHWLLDAQSLDLVQHIGTVLDAIEATRSPSASM